MIQHVYELCTRAQAESVTVATDDERIVDCVDGLGGTAVVTSADHQSGSDRIAEASSILGLEDDAVVVNVQGDEPDMPVSLIEQVAAAIVNDESIDISTASASIDNVAQVSDPSVVKVVVDRDDKALYFSRSAIPWQKSGNLSEDFDLSMVRRHLGIYAYRVGYVKAFSARQPCVLEQSENLEQLRALWYGERIRCIEAVEAPGPGIDTEADLARIRARFSNAIE